MNTMGLQASDPFSVTSGSDSRWQQQRTVFYVIPYATLEQ